MVAARAERNAFCFSFLLICLTSTFWTTGGWASLPPFAWGIFAALEPPLILGTWATPRPEPQLWADERIPA